MLLYQVLKKSNIPGPFVSPMLVVPINLLRNSKPLEDEIVK